jgi:hypothetical protein
LEKRAVLTVARTFHIILVGIVKNGSVVAFARIQPDRSRMKASGLVGFLVSLLSFAACGDVSSNQDEAVPGTEAGTDVLPRAPTDPNCIDNSAGYDLPNGSCVLNATCNFYRKTKCPDGSDARHASQWACQCLGVGQWECEYVTSGLSLPSCFSPDGSADVGAETNTCANLDEATCSQTEHCMPLYGTNLATGFEGYAGCQTYEFVEGDALSGASCHPILTCALDPANLSQCWLFEESDCVPDGWSSIFECNAPECASFQDAG